MVMSPAIVFVVPLVVTTVLMSVTGLAYGHARRPYLLWWTGAWDVVGLWTGSTFTLSLRTVRVAPKA